MCLHYVHAMNLFLPQNAGKTNEFARHNTRQQTHMKFIQIIQNELYFQHFLFISTTTLKVSKLGRC